MSESINYYKQALASLRQTDIAKTKKLHKQNHELYMKNMLHNIGDCILHYNSAHGWIYYYIVNSLTNLGCQIRENQFNEIIHALKLCYNQKQGGFGGGYMQVAHLLQTYACFLTILLIGQNAYHLIDKGKLTKFIKSCKKQGKFEVATQSQIDLRASYIATIIVKLLNLDEDLLKGVPEQIIALQTYEGGLSYVKGGEAHGGYTFCGVAVLSLLGRLHELDIPRLTFWLSRRQYQIGGFCGRTNKFVDSCYSLWVGAIFNILNNYFQNKISYNSHLIYSEENLQNFVTFFCQDESGGFRDKPGKDVDLYHSCYALAGLALSQDIQCVRKEDKLEQIDPIYHVKKSKVEEARKYFSC